MILAKPDESLITHIENSLKVFLSIKNTYTNVPKLCGVPQFWDNLFYAVFLHDFGKGAEGFQKSLTSGKRWGYRHEILSAGFVAALDMKDNHKKAIGLAIITHHKDIEELRMKYATSPERKDNPGYEKYLKKAGELNLKELNEILNYIPDLSNKYLGRELKNYHYINDYNELTNVYNLYVKPYYKDYKTSKLTPLHKTYGIFLKGFLTACDHLASAGEREIKKAVDNIDKYINFKTLTSVQQKAKTHKGNLFLISPTGSGKTEAALFWAHNNQNKTNSKRVFYILPFTASINYMYKRFIKMFKSDELVSLLHGKSSYFLYRFFSEGEDNYDYKKINARIRQIQSLSKKIFKPYKVLTPFQLIKAFFGIKGFEQNISEMTNGLFIFDEIHSYDPRTTALILQISKYIKEILNGNFLFMTATMPQFLKEILKSELKIKNEIKLTKGELKRIKRHNIKVKEGSISDCCDNIIKDIENGKRVLVVVNTVRESQEIYRKLKDKVKDILLLHGRFILKDREEKESSIKNNRVLIGTQVIEVSLDIDYDVLYTESAPIDVLLQRFGRVNRRGRIKNAPVYIFTESSDKGYIYNKERADKSMKVLKKTDFLDEYIIQELIDFVYENGYSEKEKKLFEDVSSSFEKLLESNVPFIDAKKNESDFYKLFNSVEIIPSRFFNDYLNEIENKRFFEAMKYILSISLPQYNFLKRKNKISKTDFGIYAEVKYDSDEGLLIDYDGLEETDII